MNITNISVSRKQVWDTCEQQYKYKYHLKLPIDDPEPFYFVYGTIVHKIAQEYVGGKGTRTIGDITGDVLSGAILLDEQGRKAPPLPAEYKRKLPEHIKNIARITEQTGYDGLLEYNFKYDLDPPNGRHVLGFIDRLIQKDDKFWVIDYKTTKQGPWRKGPKEIVYDLQLRCYAKVIQKEFGAKAENIKCALYYLDGGEVVGATFSQNSLDLVEKELLETYMQIQTTDPDKARGNVGTHCNRCDYRRICPFYSPENTLMQMGLI